MTKSIILFLVSIILPTLFSEELNLDKYVYSHQCYFDSKRYTFAISQDDFNNMKVWNLNDKTGPPVLPQDAERLARRHIDKIKIQENQSWLLESISLVSINPLKLDKFVYCVQYKHVIDKPMSGRRPYMKYIITMDGKFIEPIVDEYEK